MSILETSSNERAATRMTLRERITTLVLGALLLFGAWSLHVYH